jgi:hypothetical protein
LAQLRPFSTCERAKSIHGTPALKKRQKANIATEQLFKDKVEGESDWTIGLATNVKVSKAYTERCVWPHKFQATVSTPPFIQL